MPILIIFLLYALNFEMSSVHNTSSSALYYLHQPCFRRPKKYCHPHSYYRLTLLRFYRSFLAGRRFSLSSFINHALSRSRHMKYLIVINFPADIWSINNFFTRTCHSCLCCKIICVFDACFVFFLWLFCLCCLCLLSAITSDRAASS